MNVERYANERARARVLGCYDRKPHEAALGKEAEPFERAKAQWLYETKKAIEEVEALTLEEFLYLRSDWVARKPNVCFECGQEYKRDA